MKTLVSSCVGVLVTAGLLMPSVGRADSSVAVWSDPGVRGNFANRDFFSGSFWQGGTAPVLTNSAALDVSVDLSAMPSEAKRLEELKNGANPVTTKYYGLVNWYHEFSDASNWSLYLDSLVGGRWMRWQLWWTSWGYPLVIRDPSTFQGWFDVKDRDRGSYSALYLQSTASFTSTVNRACASGSLGIKVPTGTHAVVKELFGPGLLPVNCDLGSPGRCALPSATAGTLEVMNRPGPLTDVRVYDGGLVLHGSPDSEKDEIAGAPALRLDASRADTITTVEENGRTFVTEWRDADGRTLCKAVPNGTYGRPFLAVDGELEKPVVDFGSCGDDAGEKFGPSGCLKLSSTLAKAREIHVVFRDHYRADTMPTIVGNTLGEWDRDWLRHYWGTLADAEGFSDTPTLAGRTLFDGQTTSADARPETIRSLHAMSVALDDHDAKISYLGYAGSDAIWRGGLSIAELIVYTNELTLAERAHTHRYLMRKWRPDLRTDDFGSISLEKASSTLSVADGTVRVRELRLPAGTKTFVKRGAGVLEVGKVIPAGVTFEIEEGGVSFASLVAKTAAPSEPAADPTAWFDATRWQTDIEPAETLADGKTRVGVWHDRRGRGFANLNGDVYTMKTPVIANTTFSNATVEAAAGGLALVDCGPFIALDANKKPTNEASTLAFYRNGVEEQSRDFVNKSNTDYRHRELFVVFVKTDAKGHPIGSHNSTIVMIANTSGLVDRSYSGTRLMAGHHTLNGEWVDLHTAAHTLNEVQVLGLRGTRPMEVNGFFRDRNYNSGCGGGKLGEVIAYDRVLTPQERRDTELYLLNKWKGVAVHPEDEFVGTARASVAGVAVKVGAGGGETVDIGEARTEHLTKVGSGDLKADVDYETVKCVRAEGGTLTLGCPVIFGAGVHVDATDLSSMTYAVADGGATTNVSKWGVATAQTTYTRNSFTTSLRMPQLVTDSENIGGVSRPYVDFGTFATCESPATDQTMAADFPEAAAMDLPMVETPSEFYIVQRDTGMRDMGGTTKYEQVLGTMTEQNGCYAFLRGAGQQLLQAEWPYPALWNGYISCNGTVISGSTWPNASAHVYCFVPLTSLYNRFGFAQRCNYQRGGGRIGECAIFSQTNTVARRQQIERHLCHKWLGQGEPVVPALALESLTCANGGVVAFAEQFSVRAAAVGGNGVLAFPTGGGVTGVTSLDFTFRGKDDFDALAVDGDFAVGAAGTVTVTLNLAANTKASKLAGEYVLFSAKTYQDFANFDNWEIRFEGAALKYAIPQVRAVEGRGLVLTFDSVGMVILVK